VPVAASSATTSPRPVVATSMPESIAIPPPTLLLRSFFALVTNRHCLVPVRRSNALTTALLSMA
jgi:hypothetical protein